MNTKGFRRMLFGEKMPDKNDPQYKERYERDVNAGRKFAQATRLDKLSISSSVAPGCAAMKYGTRYCSLSWYSVS